MRTLVYRFWNLPLRLRSRGIFVESLGSKDGSDFRRNFRISLGCMGRDDVEGICLGVDSGTGLHGFFGRGFHMARDGRMDRSFVGRAEAVRSLAHHAHADGVARFHRGAGEKPVLGLKSAICGFFEM